MRKEERIRVQNAILQDRVKDGAELLDFPEVEARAVLSLNGKVVAIGFVGSAMKPSFNYRFRDEAQARQYVQDWIEGLRVRHAAEEERKQKRDSFQHTLKAGDILSSLWGYDQTNVDYYQVIETKPKSVIVRQIKHRRVETVGWCSEMVEAVKDAFCEKEPAMLRRVGPGNRIKVQEWGVWASPWDGKPDKETSYA